MRMSFLALRAHSRFPDNLDILTGLVAFYRDNGNTEAARIYADKLNSIYSERAETE